MFMKNIILASTSIYRKQQLQRLNIGFSTASPNVDEGGLKSQGLDHIQLSRELSLLKARAVSAQNRDAIVIGGDQVASFNGAILSKPGTKETAFDQLKTMSGHEHQLITSLAIILDGEEHLHTCIARMRMRSLTGEQIERYIDLDEPLQCCGSYRLEALGISLFESIDCEDFTSIIGIPLMWTARTLSQLGVSVP
jgi:septum formation protein